MSIRPQFASAILAGTKLVEFRKRRLAHDITTVLIYATLPVGRVVGTFGITGYDLGSPTAVWELHKKHAGISRDGYRDYYRGINTAVAIKLADVRPLGRPIRLAELDSTLRAPQSFCYLDLDPFGGSAETLVAELAAVEPENQPVDLCAVSLRRAAQV